MHSTDAGLVQAVITQFGSEHILELLYLWQNVRPADKDLVE